MPSCSPKSRRSLPRQVMAWSLDRGDGPPMSVHNWDVLHYS